MPLYNYEYNLPLLYCNANDFPRSIINKISLSTPAENEAYFFMPQKFIMIKGIGYKL